VAFSKEKMIMLSDDKLISYNNKISADNVLADNIVGSTDIIPAEKNHILGNSTLMPVT
jgi:hypothetical protein